MATAVASVPDGAAATSAKDGGVVMANGGRGGVERAPVPVAPAQPAPAKTNGHELSVSSPEKAGMSEELKDIFNKLIDDQGHLDMRNVTTLIWVNRIRPEIVETIVELLIENSNERRVFNGIEFYLPQLAHMIIHLDIHLPSSALEQFALVVCQQSLHVALQFNWILVAALEDYHAELPDGSRNKKANTVFFNRCAKLLQNVERIIALGAPSAAGLEELYKTGQLSRHEVDSRTIAERKKRAEKVIGSPKRGIVASATEEYKASGWLWHKRWHKRGFPHRSQWIRRWFEVEDRVLYCYDFEHHGENKVKRAAVLYQASVKDCDYKDTKYAHYFEVHSPMGSMRLRAEDASGKTAWIHSLKKQAQAMPAVAHLYTHDGPSTSVTAGRGNDSPSGSTPSTSRSTPAAVAAAAGKFKLARPSSITEGDESFDQDEARPEPGAEGAAGATAGAGAGGGAGAGPGAEAGEEEMGTVKSALAVSVAEGVAGGGNAETAAAKILAGTRSERQSAMSMSTVVLQEAKRNRRFRFFSEERQFVSDLTDVCETLRFLDDRSKRNEMLESLLRKVHIPECGYLPLCRSTEPFQRVIKITLNEAKAFSTKERVPSLVTFETEQTWAPGTESAGHSPLDVASFLHFAYGFHAPMHQDHQRYSSIALRGGEDSFMEPDLLAVSDVRDGEEMPTPRRHSRNGSFRFRAGSKGLPFPNMPPVHLPGSLSTVWRDKPGGADAAKAKEARGGKSPFRHNLSSLGSALHARASSIRNVKLPLGRQSTAKRGMGATGGLANTLGSGGGASAAGEEKEKEGIFDGVSGAAAASAKEGEGDSGKPKSVVWGGEGEAPAEKVEKPAVEPTPGSGVQAYSGEPKEAQQAKDAKEAMEAREKEAASALRPSSITGSIAEEDDTGGAVTVDEAGLDRALQEPSVPRSRSRSESGFPAGLDDISLADSNCRSTTNDAEIEDEELRTPVKAYGESMATKARRIRKQSLEGGRSGWVLQRLIMKSNDDVRQEVFVMQLITFYKEVFEREGLPLWLKPYSILSTAKTTGLIEVLNQSTSLDGLKKSKGYAGSLLKHFVAVYGPEDSAGFKAAQRRFACSLAGYSVVSYLLGFKDRHNGNVMLDSDGHIVHIDFGFVLGSAPGKKFSMERAAFKCTAEYVEVLGGSDSKLYEEFVDMFTKGLQAARKYATVTITMIEIMMFKSEFPCFEYMGDAALKLFKRRLMMGCKDSDVTRRARRMVNKANAHWGTRLYDRFQLWSNGIMP